MISLWTEQTQNAAAGVDAQVRRIEEERKQAVEKLVATVLSRKLEQAPAGLREKLRQARLVATEKRTAEQIELLRLYPRVEVTAGNVELYDGTAHAKLVREFAAKVEQAQSRQPAEDCVSALTEVTGRVPVTRVLFRGDMQQPRQAVEPAELQVLALNYAAAPIPLADKRLPTTGRRLAYARLLTDGRHPLAARVLVNRVWMHHFGRGLVDTPSNFGSLGEHPRTPSCSTGLPTNSSARAGTSSGCTTRS